jgi:hypothetical protein
MIKEQIYLNILDTISYNHDQAAKTPMERLNFPATRYITVLYGGCFEPLLIPAQRNMGECGERFHNRSYNCCRFDPCFKWHIQRGKQQMRLFAAG